MSYAAETARLFADKVLTGLIPACRYVKSACKRHLDDLAAQEREDFPFYFDEEEAERFVKFAQLMPHTKGEWAFKRQLIKLEPWQVFGFAVSFGWKNKDDGTRRFIESYWEVPRKNGKSIIAAVTGLYAFAADNEFGAEVYSGATTEKQAWEVFKPAKLMVQKTTPLAERFNIRINAKSLVRPDDESRFEPIIGTPGDGASPSCAIVDEYHEHKDDSLYSTMRTGMGARKQPILFIITTAGDNIEGPCYDKRREVVDMLEGTIDNDRLFGWIWTIDEDDDWKDPVILKKANPNFGVSVYEKFLINEQRDAVNNARKQPYFKTKHLNIWVQARKAFFNLEKWRACEDVFDVEDFEGQECILGFDLAAKTDLNAKIPVYRRMIEGRTHYYIVAPRFWVPYDTIYYSDNQRLSETYQKFENSGYLTVVDGAEMDYRAIRRSAKELHEFSPVKECGIDPHGATCLLHDLDDEGMTPVVVQQNFTGMSDAMKELEAAILSRRLHHDGNPILTWCIANIVGKYLQGSDDIVRPIKEHPDKKIDGGVALINALNRAMLSQEEEEAEAGVIVL